MLKTERFQKVSPRKVSKPYRGREADVFALWLSIPIFLREQSQKQLEKMGYDMEDNELVLVLKAQTKTQLSKILKVTRKQLAIWESSDVIKKKVEELNLLSNVMRFKKDIDYHFTQKTMKESDAPRVKLWKQFFEGWQERSQVSDPRAAEALEKNTELIVKLLSRK